MTEDETVRIRARRSRLGKPAIRPDQATELRELYSELQGISAAAVEAMGATGVPTGLALERFLELHARASTILERSSEILG
jgi:hypothetical protein